MEGKFTSPSTYAEEMKSCWRLGIESPLRPHVGPPLLQAGHSKCCFRKTGRKTGDRRGLALTPGFWGLRSLEGNSLRQEIPESIFSGRMPVYERTYSPGQLPFIATSIAPRRLAVVKLEVLFLAGCLPPPHGPIAMRRLILQVPSGNRRPPKTRSVPARLHPHEKKWIASCAAVRESLHATSETSGEASADALE